MSNFWPRGPHSGERDHLNPGTLDQLNGLSISTDKIEIIFYLQGDILTREDQCRISVPGVLIPENVIASAREILTNQMDYLLVLTRLKFHFLYRVIF